MNKNIIVAAFFPLTTLLIIPLFFVLLLKWRWKHCAFLFSMKFRPHGTPVIPLFPLLIGQWNFFSGAGVLR